MTAPTVTVLILDRIDAILTANVLTGTQVFRDRADAQSRAETPCVNVLAREDSVNSFAQDIDRHELTVELRFNVRDELPTPLVEAQHAAVHRAIVQDAQLLELCDSVRLQSCSFEREEADATSLIKTAPYRFIYLLNEDTL